MEISKHTYTEGNISIEVPFTGEAFINATIAAKPFKKQASKWLENKQTEEYIEVLAESKNLLTADLHYIKKGGNDKTSQGTWIHPDLAIFFARWISPRFAIWCDGKIKEILAKGYTGINAEVTEELDAIAPHVQSVQKYIKETGGVRMPQLINLFSEMEKNARTILDYRNTLSKLTLATDADSKESMYNKLIQATYKAFNQGVIERRTEEDLLQILNTNLVKLLRRRQTAFLKKLSNGVSDSEVNKYIDEINQLKDDIETHEARSKRQVDKLIR
jgi:hypothetical protein